MPGTGTATINFGAAPGGHQAQVAVTGQTTIVSGSLCEAFMMLDSTADHSADEHLIAPIRLVCGSVVAGTGFTIYACSEWSLTGSFSVRWVWS